MHLLCLLLICWIYPCQKAPPENQIFLGIVKDRACFCVIYPEKTQQFMAELYGEHPATTLHVNYPFLPPKSYSTIHLEKWAPLGTDDICECYTINND